MQPVPCSADVITWIVDHPQLRVVRLSDPMVEAAGFDAPGDYVERYWLGTLGPTALSMLRRLADRLMRQPDGFSVALADLARELGVGDGTGRNAPVVKAIARLVRFRMAAVQGDALAVPGTVPPVPRRHLARLPQHLAEEHRVAMDAA